MTTRDGKVSFTRARNAMIAFHSSHLSLACNRSLARSLPRYLDSTHFPFSNEWSKVHPNGTGQEKTDLLKHKFWARSHRAKTSFLFFMLVLKGKAVLLSFMVLPFVSAGLMRCHKFRARGRPARLFLSFLFSHLALSFLLLCALLASQIYAE